MHAHRNPNAKPEQIETDMTTTPRVTARSMMIASLAIGAVASYAAAQDLTHKAPPQTLPVVIRGATVHPVSGPPVENATVLFMDGVIRQIAKPGEALNLPQRVVPTEVNAAGKHMYPGLISAATTLGLTEIGAVRATRDSAEVGDVTPEVRAAVAVNPDSWHMPVTRSNGVLLAGVMPNGGAIPGRMSVIRLDGWTWEAMAVRDDAGLVIEWPSIRPVRAPWMERSEDDQLKESAKRLAVIEDLFAQAEAYFAARTADPTTLTSVRLEALGPTLRKEKPVYINAQDMDQIQSAVSWGAKRGLSMVIVGGRDAAACADFLKKHNVGVIVTGTHRMPRRADSAYDEAYQQPATLEAAGLRWCLTGPGLTGNGNDRNLPYQASMAAAHGLDREAALRSVTLGAAQLLGVADAYGSLEPGKSATLLVTDGDPLEISTKIEAAYIDGRAIDLSNKQTKLAEKYREKYRQLGILPPAGEKSQSKETTTRAPAPPPPAQPGAAPAQGAQPDTTRREPAKQQN